MDSPLSFMDDDEVIADSEEEMEGPGLENRQNGRNDAFAGPARDLTSSVSAFTFTNHQHQHQNAQPKDGGVSSISTFTAGPSHYSYNAQPMQRGQENEKGKGKEAQRDADTSIASAYTEFQVDDFGFVGTASIADRAKTRQRTQSKANLSKGVSSDVIELTSDEDDDEDELSLKPSKTKAKDKAKAKTKAKAKAKETPKPKPKPTPKAKEKEKTTPPPNDATTSSTSSDPTTTTTTNPPPRPRPRPRPIIKRPKTTHDINDNAPGDLYAYSFALNPPRGPFPPTSTPPLPSSHSNSGGPELPVATSPPSMPPPSMGQGHEQGQRRLGSNYTATAGMPSQLPPSDPPIPSLTTAYGHDNNDDDELGGYGDGERERALPHIEVLQEPDPQLSSPSSLFSDDGSRKRKRSRLASEVDELVTSPGAGDANYSSKRLSLSPSKMPPPPTFFAGSSSSSIGGGRDRNRNANAPGAGPASGSAAAPAAESGPEVVDLTMLPCTMPVAGRPAAGPPKPAKAKKPRKKNAVAVDMLDEQDFTAPMMVLDEDDADGDFDPAGDGDGAVGGKKKAKKGKAKAKDTEKKAKAAKSKPKKGKEQVEVVITTRPVSGSGSGAKTKADAKGKGKVGDKGMGAGEDKEKQDKEVFKSREFIEDSDEEVDPAADPLPLGVVGHNIIDTPGTSSSSASSTKKTNKTIAQASSGPAPGSVHSAGSVVIATSSGSKSKSDAPASSSNAPLEAEADLDMLKKKTKTKGKKRKSIVDSDAEEEHEEETVVVVKKKQKKAAKNVLLSDEEEQDEGAVKSGSARKEKGKGEEKDAKKQSKRSSKMVVSDDEEEVGVGKGGGDATEQEEDSYVDNSFDVQEQQTTPEEKGTRKGAKENVVPPTPAPAPIKPAATPKPSSISARVYADGTTPLYARYEIAPRRSSLPMSELIKRANSMPGSPFASTPSTLKNKSHLSASTSTSASTPTTAHTPTTYSPYLKSSRRLLSRIAPLHPNRRTPPPPPPPPPPRKKSKKELEMEEKWEEEMVDSVGGVEVWAAMEEGERRAMRRAKEERERGGWED